MNLNELQELLGVSVETMEVLQDPIPVAALAPTVKLVPRPTVAGNPEPVSPVNLLEKLQEIEMARKLGYLLCKCSWPPQIMVLTGADHIWRCRRCSRVREM